MAESHVLINVSLREESPVTYFPVGIGFIATAIKNGGFEFNLLDIDLCRYSLQDVEKRISAEAYDVILMGTIVTGYKKIKERCKDQTNTSRLYYYCREFSCYFHHQHPFVENTCGYCRHGRG